MTLPTSSVISESLRNTFARPVRAAIYFVSMLALMVLTVGFSCYSVYQIVDRQMRLEQNGSDVFRVSTSDRSVMSGVRCVELESVDGVENAGGIASTETISNPVKDSFIHYEVVGSYMSIIWPELTKADWAEGVVLGANLASQLGAVSQASVLIGTANVEVGATAKNSTRDERADDVAMSLVVAEQDVTECLVEATPGAGRAVDSLLAGWFASASGTNVSPYFVDSSIGPSPQEELDTRSSFWVPLVTGSVVATMLLLLWNERRPEFALYRLIGLSRGHVALMLGIDIHVFVVTPAAMVTIVSAVILPRDLSPVVIDLILMDFLRMVLVGIGSGAVGVLLVTGRSSIAALKGR